MSTITYEKSKPVRALIQRRKSGNVRTRERYPEAVARAIARVVEQAALRDHPAYEALCSGAADTRLCLESIFRERFCHTISLSPAVKTIRTYWERQDELNRLLSNESDNVEAAASEAEIESMSPEELRRRARYSGEVYSGGIITQHYGSIVVAISGVEILQQWMGRPDYMAIMSDCGNIDIGVWSENLVPDRSVVVAVYGKGDSAAPVPAPPRQFGQRPPNQPNF